MDSKRLVTLLDSWSAGAGPLYRLLAAALQRAILEGNLPAGTRLPAERALAQALTVSRTTVMAAYDRLRQENWLESRTGSGTWVRPLSGERAAYRNDRRVNPLPHHGWATRLSDEREGLIDLTKADTGSPVDLPAAAFVLDKEELAHVLTEYGYTPLGLPRLRQALADRFTRTGLATSADQVLITTGAQQAIALLAALYVQRGDTVLIDNPTYAGAIDAFRGVGGRLVPVPVTAEGLQIDVLRGLLGTVLAQVIYLMPTCQNPTGLVLPDADRRAVATLAAAAGVPLVEDNTLAELVLDGTSPPPLAAYTPTGPIITIGSASKLFWAGLRIGWVRAAAPIIARLGRLKAVADLGSDLIAQAIVARLLPEAERIGTARRQELRVRCDLLCTLLATWLPTWSAPRPAGGSFLWVRLPYGEAAEYAQVALRYGVRVTPGRAMSVDESHSAYLRLPFFLEPASLEEGVRRLAAAWAHYAPLADSTRQTLQVVV